MKNFNAIFMLFLVSLFIPTWAKSETTPESDTPPGNPIPVDAPTRSKAPSRKNIEIIIQGNALLIQFLSAEGNANMEILDEYTGNTESYSFDTSISFSCILSNSPIGSFIIIETGKGNIYNYKI